MLRFCIISIILLLCKLVKCKCEELKCYECDDFDKQDNTDN